MPDEPESIGCLCGCGRTAYSRGLSATCYTQTFKLVKAGKTTWEERERQGLALPPKPMKQRARGWRRYKK